MGVYTGELDKQHAYYIDNLQSYIWICADGTMLRLSKDIVSYVRDELLILLYDDADDLDNARAAELIFQGSEKEKDGKYTKSSQKKHAI